eukprot:GHVN01105781.1.p1 GENE.GHVN01105781.1~~GHVN01105781.1.p1  ORF type:complete len:149 (+),score=0.87 GHVN01105781.1:82-528(+)
MTSHASDTSLHYLEFTGICSRLTTLCLHMGHLLLCIRTILAHELHKHMCRHGKTAVSRSSVKQITHSLPFTSAPGASSSLGCSPPLGLSDPIPYTACTSYSIFPERTHCFSLEIPHRGPCLLIEAYVICPVHTGAACPSGLVKLGVDA